MVGKIAHYWRVKIMTINRSVTGEVDVGDRADHLSALLS